MKSTSITIIQTLREHGFSAYFAGGCVRDMMLSVPPKDFDIVTNATPDQIEALFEKTYPVGKEFGVILVHRDGYTFEVATFRSDSGYSDGRRPDYVTFTDPKQDALRRDFTINALYLDPLTDEVLDFVDGVKDIEGKLVRFVGEPERRIQEDHLRLLRAVRFKNTLGFTWEEGTYDAVKKYAHLITDVSAERVRDELNKIMNSDNCVDAFIEMYELGMLKHILPEIEELHGVAQPSEYHREGDVLTHTFRTLAGAVSKTIPYMDSEFLKSMDGGAPEPSAFHVRWASLFHDIAKPHTSSFGEDTRGVKRIKFNHHAEGSGSIVETILRRLRFPLKDIEHIVWLTTHHMMLNTLIEMEEGSRNKWFRHPYFIDLMEVFNADIAGTEPAVYDDFQKLNRLYHAWLLYRPVEFPKLLSGDEIMKLTNLTAGVELGKVVNLLNEQIHAQKVTTKAQAIEFVLQYKE